MKMFHSAFVRLVMTFTLCLLPTAVGWAVEEAWTEDMDAAIKRAGAEDKDLLLLFTGSDWCPPCKKLEADILSQESFQTEISKHFVLVKFDFPNDLPQSAELVKQNQEWSNKYGIDGYPTIYLVDKAQKPFAIAGFKNSTVAEYLEMLETSRQIRVRRDEKMKLAEGKPGLERAKLLDEAVSEIRQEIVALYYPEIVKEIVELDKDDKIGLRTKWNESKDLELRKVIMTDMMMVARLERPESAIAFIDEVLGEFKFPSSEKLQILQMKLNLARQLKDDQLSDKILDEMIGLDGVTGETQERLIVKKIYLMLGSGRVDAALKLLDDSIVAGQSNLHLLLAKGEILSSQKKPEEAIKTYDQAILAAGNDPDVLIDLISAKADGQYELKLEADALQTLDRFADDTQQPVDLRAEALLHKAMLMRDMNRVRQARLAENRAVEISTSVEQRAQIQKLVDRLRKKYGE